MMIILTSFFFNHALGLKFQQWFGPVDRGVVNGATPMVLISTS